MSTELVKTPELPAIVAGTLTPEVQRRVHEFYQKIAAIFETWVNRSESAHTQRSYRESVMSFVRFMGFHWPKDAPELLRVSVLDVQAFRKSLVENGAANKTMNARICALSSFYKFLGESAAELRLPIIVPNPASTQFVKRAAAEPRDETKALSVSRARMLMNMPSGDDVLDYRDRAILKFYLYTGARLASGSRLKVSDFHYDHENPTVKLHLKGNRTKMKGIHPAAAEAIHEYLEKAGITSGPLFRARLNSRSQKLGNRRLDVRPMWALLRSYLLRLPGATVKVQAQDGTTCTQCVYTPHSLRATAATLLLDTGVEITEVQELLDHKHITTTQIYEKRRRTTRQSASHKMPF